VADLEKTEIERQCKFYQEQKLEFPPQLKEKLEKNALFSYLNPSKSASQSTCSTDADAASSATASDSNSNTKSEANSENNSHSANKSISSFHRNDEQIALSLEPLDGLKVALIF
jgi:hypothetical protein